MKAEIEKKILREKMKALRDSIVSSEHIKHSNLISERILNLVIQGGFKVVHSYLPYRSEVNIFPCLKSLMQKQVKIIAPKTMKHGVLKHLELMDTEKISIGRYGVPFPSGNLLYTGPIDLIIVPGLAFDKGGNRLGYGGGYYDRFLSAHPESLKIGVCFPGQMVEQVPKESWDVVLDDIYFTAS